MTGKKGTALRKLIKELGLTKGEIGTIAHMFYNQKRYTDPVALEEKVLERAYRQTGKLVEFNDCNIPERAREVLSRVTPGGDRDIPGLLNSPAITVCR